MSLRRVLPIALRMSLFVATMVGCTAAPTVTLVPPREATATTESAVEATPVDATAPPSSAPTSAPTATALPPWPPRVLSHVPERGQELGVDRPLELRFDQPMNADTVASAVTIAPEVALQSDWSDDGRTLSLQPANGWLRDTEYVIEIGAQAVSSDGLALREPFGLRFRTIGYLEVTSSSPGPDSQGVSVDAPIRVAFNRPVVPMSAIDTNTDTTFLQMEPQVDGVGRWVNTSIYSFEPETPFPAGTEIAVGIPADLKDLTGGIMGEAYRWSFTTEMPSLTTVEPLDGANYVAPSTALALSFSQAMDAASVATRLRLHAVGSEEDIPGTLAGFGARFIFTPTVSLERGQVYEAELRPGARPLDVGDGASEAVADGLAWRFTVAPLPSIERIVPADGALGVSLGEGIEIAFTTPMSRESAVEGIIIEPEAQTWPYWQDDDTVLMLGTWLQPSTRYTLTIGADLVDRMGTRLGRSRTVTFETAPLDASVWMRTPGRVGTYSAYAQPTVYVEHTNVDAVELLLHKLDLESFLALNGEDSWETWREFEPDSAQQVNSWWREVDAPLNARRILSQTLETRAGDALEPGYYMLECGSPQAKNGPQRHILVVTRTNLLLKASQGQILVWATDLWSGEPVQDIALRLYDGKGQVVTQMVTDDSGLAQDEIADLDAWAPLIVLGEGTDDATAALRYWSSGISPWAFGLSSELMQPHYRAHVYTDRSLYRPGQTVYFKGVLRRDYDATYDLPPADVPLWLAAIDAEGREFWKQPALLSAMGTFDGELVLGEDASLGDYQLQVRLGDPDRPTADLPQPEFYGANWRVAEYRKPEFQLDVALDKPDYINGSSISAGASASYYFGGPVADADVTWRAMRQPYVFDRWLGKGYVSWADDDDYGYDDRPVSSIMTEHGALVTEGRTQTDADGTCSFGIPAELDGTEAGRASGSQRYTVEATVTDVNNQQVSSRSTAIVHQGTFYIGLRAERYVTSAGKPLDLTAMTVDTRGITRTQQALDVTFYQHEWFSAQEELEDGRFFWTNKLRRTAILTETVATNDQGVVHVSFEPPRGGAYKVVAQGVDEFGNRVRSGLLLWVSDQEYVNWGQRNDERLDLVADKKEYQPGDVAEILVPSPYGTSVQGLMTVERGGILEHRLLNLKGTSELIRVPIDERYAPNVFVSVVLVQGAEDGDLPSYRVGYVELPVSVDRHRLQVRVAPVGASQTSGDAAGTFRASPGDEVTYAIEARDHTGAPVEAEVSLQLVDLAIEALVGGDTRPDMLETFYRQRGLGVQTASTLGVFVDRYNLDLADGGKGGGGGGPQSLVRQDFPDTAFWAPRVQTNQAGRAEVTVTLPDNLTTWRMTAQAITRDTRIGRASVDIVSSLDLLVRPVLPRFLVLGDEPTLGAVLHNNTTHTLDVTVRASGSGLDLADIEQHVQIPGGERISTQWPARVVPAGSLTATAEIAGMARFRVSANATVAGDSGADGPSDAVEIAMPVFYPSTLETVGTSGQVSDHVLEVIEVPGTYKSLPEGRLEVTLEPSLAAGMQRGLAYLESYPYDCVEQTVSRFLPNVVTYRALQALGIDDPRLAARLPQQVGVALQRLYELQNLDGGWGWWTEETSSPLITAYVVMGLTAADDASFAVDEAVIDKAVAFLDEWLYAPHEDSRQHRDERAAVLYMLAEAGRGELAATVALYEQELEMSLYARAYLAMALQILSPNETGRLLALEDELVGAAVLSAAGTHWQDTGDRRWAMDTDTRTSAIVLRALLRLNPEQPLLPNAVRWLMNARSAAYWETTQENVWAILALTDYMVATGELLADYDYELWLSGERIVQRSVTPDTLDEAIQVTVPLGDLDALNPTPMRIKRSDDATGKLYYTAYMHYYVPADEVEALNRGMVLQRDYFRLPVTATPSIEGAAIPSNAERLSEGAIEASVGDTILVRLTLILPNDAYFLVVENPLPAGCEAIDTSMATTAATDRGAELVEWDVKGAGGRSRSLTWATHSELRDEKVALFADLLSAGTYEYTYTVRCTTPGVYNVMPATAHEMYFPDTFGRSAGGTFVVR